jgi:hypothetical protein
VRTVIAPLHPKVQEELRALDRRRAQIARRYIQRLALEPYLGARVERGLLAEYGCRRIHFDRDDHPDDLFGARLRRSAVATRARTSLRNLTEEEWRAFEHSCSMRDMGTRAAEGSEADRSAHEPRPRAVGREGHQERDRALPEA